LTIDVVKIQRARSPLAAARFVYQRPLLAFPLKQDGPGQQSGVSVEFQDLLITNRDQGNHFFRVVLFKPFHGPKEEFPTDT
jgi:hypothetical protein